MSRSRWLGPCLWLLLLALAAVVVARARYSADLSAFLPRAPTASQQLLVQQLRDGLASRLILIGIEGGGADARALVSHAVAAALRRRPEFVSVSNGEQASQDQDREFVFRHRYQLSPTVTPARFSVEGLNAAIEDNLQLLASPAGLLAKSLFQADPTGETLQVIDQLEEAAGPRREQGVWSSGDGTRALLIAQTRAVGSDTDAQAQAIALIRSAFASAAPAPDLRLAMTGPGVFSVEARATIEHEAVRLSLLSTAVIVTLLLLVYRSLPTLLFGLLPVASGALAGVAAVALGFGVVHGITLGFGVTLIGESVDYSIYLFIQSCRPGGADDNALWRTIGLGVLTSVCGFASLLPSSFPGLAQLGLYSISGLLAAAAVTRWVLPQLLPQRFPIADLVPLGSVAARGLARAQAAAAVLLPLALVCALLLYRERHELWNKDLSALSPVAPAALALDANMRADLGAPDVGTLVIASASDEQQALQLAEQAAARLDALADSGVIGGYDSVTRFLPSEHTQRMRQASVPPEAELQSRLGHAVTGLPVRLQSLQPFVEQAAEARTAPPITRADLAHTSFALGADALLWHGDDRWHALLPLHAAAATPAVRDAGIELGPVQRALASLANEQVVVLNIKQQLDLLYASYLTEAVRLSLSGLAAIAILLLLVLRSLKRVARVIAPLLLAVLVVSAGLAACGTRLTILHLIGMLLIVAVGSNYALFFDRRAADRSGAALPLTLASLLIANTCTVVGFGVLAFAHVPVLSALGETVAPGTLLALLFAALLAPRRLTAVQS
ncbi:MAG TPA: MMPL family transporter [Steroidobacteraceae bacterium]